MINRGISIIGKRFGKLIVLERYGTKNKNSTWLCQCDCGSQAIVQRVALVRKNFTKSCGCIVKESMKLKQTTHGMTKSPTYSSWSGAKSRTLNSTSPNWYNYGGRGIKMAPEWLNSFEKFLEDMGEKPEGTSLERIDNNGNYEPSNCKWATSLEQTLNRRRFKSHTLLNDLINISKSAHDENHDHKLCEQIWERL